MRILAYTTPARGHLYPVVPILKELAERGHQSVVCTLSHELSHLGETGIDGQALDPVVERNQLKDWRESSPRRAILSTRSTFAERASAEAPDFVRAIAGHNPDVLVVDINAWGAATVAESSGRPWVMYAPYLLPLPSRDAPPFGPGLAPMKGPLGQVRDALVRRAMSAGVNRAALGLLNALRARYGLNAFEHFGEALRRPPLLLGLTAEGFEYPRSDWPTNVRLVGPLNWTPPASAPEWLDEVSDPLVLVTCSTERQDDARLLHVALEALPAAGMSVIATAAAHDPDQFNVPPGSRVARFISHATILSRAVCVVCHGGMGITQKALAAQVPVVAVPFGRDQLETARRLEVAKAGVRLAPRRLNPDRLATAVRTAIDRREGAARVSRAYASAGGQQAAADAIQALVLRLA
jgi:MGT family glycosyltransferase